MSSKTTTTHTKPPETAESDDPWGAHASTYDRVFAPLTGYIARSLLAMAEHRLSAHARVLDIACGSGALLLPAIARAERQRAAGGSDFVVGCDYSAGMVAQAQRKAALAHDPALFRCDVQNGEALSYGDASFDAVFSCFGIFLFEDRGAGWREAARVLAPGGTFATTTWMAPEHNEMFRAQFGPLSRALPERLKQDPSPPGWMLVAEAEALRSEVEAAGFVDVEVRPFHTTFVMPSVDVAWDSVLDNPFSGALIRQCDAAERRAVREGFTEGLRAYAGGGDGPVVVEASCNALIARRA